MPRTQLIEIGFQPIRVLITLLLLAFPGAQAFCSDIYVLQARINSFPLPIIDIKLDSLYGSTVGAWSFSICHDPANVDWVDLVPGAALTSLASPPDFLAITPFTTGITVDCVIDNASVISLPPENNLILHLVIYDWVPSGSQYSDIVFCSNSGSSGGTDAVIYSEGEEFTPFTFDNFLFNGFIDPFAFYSIFRSIGSYDTDSGIGSVSVTPIIAPGLAPSFLLSGLSMAVAHDSSLLQVDSVVPAGLFADLFGGTGPEVMLVELLPNGWTVDITVDSSGIVTIPFNGSQPAVTAHYSTIPSAINPGSCIASWLRFDNTLGGSNELDFDTMCCASALESNELAVLIPVSPLFSRGDVNQDSALNLADAVTQLGALFSGGPALSCQDSGDANDDGNFNIADTIFLLGFLFNSGPPPAEPFIECGTDPSVDTLGCSSFDCP
ncbi:MAG: hypothetical protein GWP35_04620 [Proteobacteria bacterium]|nr:hypothetical protein [Pseudomonadota bacterium]